MGRAMKQSEVSAPVGKTPYVHWLLQQLYGDEMMSHLGVTSDGVFKRFKEGGKNMKDDLRSGRLSTIGT